jgi:hypothetical protein
MTVYFKKGRQRWAYDFWLNKQRYEGYCEHPETGAPAQNKREAKAFEEGIRAAARQEQALAKSGLRREAYSLNQAAVLYLARKKTDAPTDYDNQVVYIREIRAFRDPESGHDFAGGHKAFVDVTPEDIEAYRTHLLKVTAKVWTGGPKRKRDAPDAARFWKDTGRPLAPRQVNKYLTALAGLFRIATKTRDPKTKQMVLDDVPDIKLLRVPKRIPRPIPDDELDARMETMAQWAQEFADLSRLFGLRHGEASWVGRRHIDRTLSNELLALRFAAGETKSKNEEIAWGGQAGTELLLKLEAQAIERGQENLITWPGPQEVHNFRAGRDLPKDCWRPLKSVRTSWKRSIERAEIQNPHRFHDVRARFVTEVAKTMPSAAQDAARHQSPSTTALYIKLADSEIRDAVSQANARRSKRGPKLKVLKG